MPPKPETPEVNTESKWTIARILKIAAGVYAAFILIPLIVGVFLARADAARAAEVMAYFRDMLTVILFLMTFVVLAGIGVMLVQIAALTGVIKIEAGEIGKEIRGAFKAVRGAAVFISESVATPAIRVLGFISGSLRFLGEVSLIRRALRRDPKPPNPPESG